MAARRGRIGLQQQAEAIAAETEDHEGRTDPQQDSPKTGPGSQTNGSDYQPGEGGNTPGQTDKMVHSKGFIHAEGGPDAAPVLPCSCVFQYTTRQPPFHQNFRQNAAAHGAAVCGETAKLVMSA